MMFKIQPPQTVQSAYDAVVFYWGKSDIHFGQGAEDEYDEAYWLMQHVTKVPLEDLERHAEDYLSQDAIETINDVANTRVMTNKPLAYILGHAWFAGLSFIVNEHTIIPRSHLVEWIEAGFEPWLDIKKVNRVLDLCCGSGCIGIALAHYFEHLHVDLADISEEALIIAQQNIEQFNIGERVKALRSDLFDSLSEQYDLILCNPPYVSEALMQQFPQEFNAEPKSAHWGGSDGLKLIHHIVRDAPNYLHKDGALIMELGSASLCLEEAYSEFPFQWLTSASGEDVVVYIHRQDFTALALNERLL